MKKNITLYYTEACHLCELAKEVFNNVSAKQQDVDGVEWKLELNDIADNEALFEAYGIRIPVVKVDDHELGWPFNENELDLFLLSQSKK